jgi:hypothetical protein
VVCIPSLPYYFLGILGVFTAIHIMADPDSTMLFPFFRFNRPLRAWKLTFSPADSALWLYFSLNTARQTDSPFCLIFQPLTQGICIFLRKGSRLLTCSATMFFARWGIGLNASLILFFLMFLDKRIIDYDDEDNNNNNNNNNKRIMMATDQSKSRCLSICSTSTFVLTDSLFFILRLLTNMYITLYTPN